MVTTCSALTALTAEDIMTRPVFTVPQDMLLPEAGRLLAREQISGAPVVDELGRCVGILSATDFLRLAGERVPAAHAVAAHGFYADWQMVDLEYVPKDAVYRHMSSDLVTAEMNTSITDLARRMLDAHIHRIVVLDGHRRPVGIVSSTDILAAVAYAGPAEERVPMPVG